MSQAAYKIWWRIDEIYLSYPTDTVHFTNITYFKGHNSGTNDHMTLVMELDLDLNVAIIFPKYGEDCMKFTWVVDRTIFIFPPAQREWNIILLIGLFSNMSCQQEYKKGKIIPNSQDSYYLPIIEMMKLTSCGTRIVMYKWCVVGGFHKRMTWLIIKWNGLK